jgi:hypothetical protein
MYRSDGSLTIGACDNLTKTIYINWGLSDPKFKKVLCHEVTHAAMFSYNVILTIEQEELLADLFATYGEEVVDITNNIFSRMRRIRAREVS